MTDDIEREGESPKATEYKRYIPENQPGQYAGELLAFIDQGEISVGQTILSDEPDWAPGNIWHTGLRRTVLGNDGKTQVETIVVSDYEVLSAFGWLQSPPRDPRDEEMYQKRIGAIMRIMGAVEIPAIQRIVDSMRHPTIQ